MKLRRGVDIPPVPLLNWNLIARPRRSITPYVSCVDANHTTDTCRVGRYAILRTDFSQLIPHTCARERIFTRDNTNLYYL